MYKLHLFFIYINMKKFKTKSKRNYLKIIVFLVLLILFIFLSFIKFDKSNTNLVEILTRDFKDNNVKIISLTNNLDYLINTYSFINNKSYNISTEKEKVLYYYNNGD